MNNTLTPAFLLHRRAYRETSFLVELFTKEYGIISVHARGARQSRGKVNVLQSFLPLLISFSGKSELKTLTHIEAQGIPFYLMGKGIFAALYINELLVLLLPKWDPHPTLFDTYEHALSELASGNCHEKTLRIFEKQFLAEIGYDLVSPDYKTTIAHDRYYRFTPTDGFRLSELSAHEDKNEHLKLFLGKNLLHFFDEQLEDEISLREAKRLVRLAISYLLGDKKLNSRQLFLEL